MSYKHIFHFVPVLILLAFFASCGQNEQDPGTKSIMRNINVTDLEPPPSIDESIDKESSLSPKNETSGKIQQVDFTQQTPENTFNTQDKRMIVRTGTMSIEADGYDETENKIKDIVKNFNGYITNSTSKLDASGRKQGSITIRVASEKFDGFVSDLSKIGKVMNQNITGKDVTEEYLDAEARQKTQRELEQRLLKLLAEKTARLTDVVEVETKLASVRENIERTEGRMRYLRDQASYSTLTVSVYEPSMLNTSTGGGFFYEIGEAFKKGLSGFTSILSGIITVFIALLPLIIILLIVLYFVLRYFKKRKAAKAQA
jgi:hypothetical protein